MPGWRRTAVGEGWPTRCLLPLPCLAAQSLWQNKPPGILGKHWEPLSGICTISWEHPSQNASNIQLCRYIFLLLNWVVASVAHCFLRYVTVTITENAVQSVACKYKHSTHTGRCWTCKQTCSFNTLQQLAPRNKVKRVVSDSTSIQSVCAFTVRGCWGSARRDEQDSGGWGRNHFHTATITGTVITLLTLTQIQIEAPKNYAQARRRKWLTSVC